MFHAAIDRFVRSAKEQVLCRFVFRSVKLKIGPDSFYILPIKSVLHYFSFQITEPMIPYFVELTLCCCYYFCTYSEPAAIMVVPAAEMWWHRSAAAAVAVCAGRSYSTWLITHALRLTKAGRVQGSMQSNGPHTSPTWQCSPTPQFCNTHTNEKIRLRLSWML